MVLWRRLVHFNQMHQSVRSIKNQFTPEIAVENKGSELFHNQNAGKMQKKSLHRFCTWKWALKSKYMYLRDGTIPILESELESESTPFQARWNRNQIDYSNQSLLLCRIWCPNPAQKLWIRIRICTLLLHTNSKINRQMLQRCGNLSQSVDCIGS